MAALPEGAETGVFDVKFAAAVEEEHCSTHTHTHKALDKHINAHHSSPSAVSLTRSLSMKDSHSGFSRIRVPLVADLLQGSTQGGFEGGLA